MTIELLKKANDLAKEIQGLKSRIERLKALRHRVEINGLDFVGFALREHDRLHNSVVPIGIDKEQGLVLLEIAIDMMKEELEKLEKEFENL